MKVINCHSLLVWKYVSLKKSSDSTSKTWRHLYSPFCVLQTTWRVYHKKAPFTCQPALWGQDKVQGQGHFHMLDGKFKYGIWTGGLGVKVGDSAKGGGQMQVEDTEKPPGPGPDWLKQIYKLQQNASQICICSFSFFSHIHDTPTPHTHTHMHTLFYHVMFCSDPH